MTKHPKASLASSDEVTASRGILARLRQFFDKMHYDLQPDTNGDMILSTKNSKRRIPQEQVDFVISRLSGP